MGQVNYVLKKMLKNQSDGYTKSQDVEFSKSLKI